MSDQEQKKQYANHVIPNSFQTPNVIVDNIMFLLADSELRVLLYAIRHILGWRNKIKGRKGTISLDMFENGYGPYPGCGLKKPAIIKALSYLAKVNIMGKDGPVTKDGQRWQLFEIMDEIDWTELEKRQLETAKTNKNRTKIIVEKRQKKLQEKRDQLSCDDTSQLSCDDNQELSCDDTQLNPGLNPSVNTKALSPQVQGDGDSDKTFANTGELGHTQAFTLWTCDGCHEQRVRVIWTPCKPGDTGLYAKCTLCGYEHIDDAPFDDESSVTEQLETKQVFDNLEQLTPDMAEVLTDTPFMATSIIGNTHAKRLNGMIRDGLIDYNSPQTKMLVPTPKGRAALQAYQAQQRKIFCGKCNGSGTVTEWEKADGCPDCGHSERPQQSTMQKSDSAYTLEDCMNDGDSTLCGYVDPNGERLQCNDCYGLGVCHLARHGQQSDNADVVDMAAKGCKSQQVEEATPAPKAKKPRKRSAKQLTMDGIVDALVIAFGHSPDTMTKGSWSLARKVAKELLSMPTPATPEQIAKVYKHCKDKFDNFGYGAIASNYAAWSTTVNPTGQSIEKDRPFTISEE